MNRPLQVCLLGVSIALLTIGMGGCGVDPSRPPLVWVTRARGLPPPEVPEPFVYAAPPAVPVDGADPSSPPVIEFFLNVVTSSPENLRLRCIDVLTGVARELQPNPTAPGASPELPLALDQSARTALLADQGVFWIEADGVSAFEKVLAIAIPADWAGAITTLEIALVDANGAAVAADQIEIARSFFYLAVIGDSVQWGNGLTDAAKFSTHVAAEIQRRTGRRVIRQVQAISGTRIVPGADERMCPTTCNGEAQRASTSILHQVDLIRHPELMDLVLMDGCINDVGVSVITDPNSAPDDIAASTRRFCGDEMQTLIARMRAAAPKATLVVTGYFPIVSEQSTLPNVLELLVTQGTARPEDTTDLVARLARNANTFLDTSRASIAAAVAAEAALHPEARALFVDPGFGPANAIFAPDALLWGLTQTTSLLSSYIEQLNAFPEDMMVEQRATACFTGELLVDPISCLYASVGHPNIRGAQVYAGAIVGALEQAAILPP